MSLVYIYSDSTGSTIDITDRCRVPDSPTGGRLQVKDQAEEAAVAISSLIVDDPDGDIEFTGHRRLYIYEDTAPVNNQVIFNGFTANERLERGPYRTGRGRQWTLDLADPNVLINRRILRGEDANRPAENDLERIQALMAMTELNTVDDDQWINTSALTTAMDAADYTRQRVGAYIDDCRQASGKNAYIDYTESLGQYALWYDFANSELYDSECFLSNTLADIDQDTTFEYSQERTYLNTDPSRIASGVQVEYDGGDVYVLNEDTLDAFAAIDMDAQSSNVKTEAKATARANRYLADAASEHQIIHTVVMVPRAKVNSIKKGQLVSFKSTYMTGFEEYVVCRVLNRTVTEISEDPYLSFELEMDLDPVTPPVEPFGILYRPQSADTNPGQTNPIGWICSGDPQPCSIDQYGVQPTVGPLATTPGTISGTIGVTQYLGFTFSGSGTIDFTSTWEVHTSCSLQQVYVDILIQGVVVATGGVITTGGTGNPVFNVDATGIAVAPGDVLTAQFRHAGSACTIYVDGVNENFTITGGALVT